MDLNPLPHPPTTITALLRGQQGELIRRIWPERQGDGTLEEALTESGHRERFGSLARHTSLLDNDLPVIAVAGLVKSGKSSTVATFLSPAGRGRIPRGMDEVKEATQRFVLWCPHCWQDDEERRQSLVEVLAGTFGRAMEFLSESPAAAKEQYSTLSPTGAEFNTPLVAFDEALDRAGCALLDCPDVERQHPGGIGNHTHELRLKVLKKASAITSALLITANQGKTAAEQFGNLVREVLAEMPGIPWWLLVNLCDDNYKPHEVLEQQQILLSEVPPRGVFLAFNFRHPPHLWKERTPRALHPMLVDDTRQRLPAFYLVEQDVARNPPEPVDENRLLLSLPVTLDSLGGVRARLRAYHSQRLMEEAAAAEQDLRKHCDVAWNQARTFHGSLLRVCLGGYLDGKGQLLVPLTAQTAERLQQALVKSAPLAERILLNLGKVGKIWGWQKKVVSRIRDKLTSLLGREENKQGLETVAGIEPQRFVVEMMREGFALDVAKTDVERIEVWKEILSRHQQFTPEEMDKSELTDAMRELWKHRKRLHKWLSLGPVGVFVLLLAAFAFASVDGGVVLAALAAKVGLSGVALITAKAGTILAYQVIGHLSLSEILIAFGITAALDIPGGMLLEKLMRDRLALPALSDLFACACDVFGLPRTVGTPITVRVKESEMPLPEPHTERGAPICGLFSSSVWELNEEGWKQLHTMLSENARSVVDQVPLKRKKSSSKP